LEKKHHFSDVSWLQQLAYLADMFNKLKEFSLSMQGRSMAVLTAEDKVASIKFKFQSWYQRVKRNKFYCFDIIEVREVSLFMCGMYCIYNV
jgi:hypothetical protein